MPLIVLYMVFQSTLPARGATHLKQRVEDLQAISIHAPRTGSDPKHPVRFIAQINFNPRSPHGERRLLLQSNIKSIRISIHAPRTGSDMAIASFTTPPGISIHAPRTGSDDFFLSAAAARKYFNPRSPHGERLRLDFSGAHRAVISIHAPRTGSDEAIHRIYTVAIEFQSTLPARGATRADSYIICTSKFQSTLPARGATMGQAKH